MKIITQLHSAKSAWQFKMTFRYLSLNLYSAYPVIQTDKWANLDIYGCYGFHTDLRQDIYCNNEISYFHLKFVDCQ